MGGVTEINERTYPRPLNPCHNAPTFLETAQPNDDWGAVRNFFAPPLVTSFPTPAPPPIGAHQSGWGK